MNSPENRPPSFELRPLAAENLSSAARRCARAMRDNPLHRRVFGGDPDRRERRLCHFFSAVLPWIERHGKLIAADANGKTLGIIGILPPRTCRPTITEQLRMLPAVSRSFAPLTPLRMRRWLAAWRKEDPTEPHWHLGPLAVDPLYQGLGIGTALLLDALERVDAAGGIAYLETDKEANVRFYERFGFVTTASMPVVGAQTWFMRRPGAATSALGPSTTATARMPPVSTWIGMAASTHSPGSVQSHSTSEDRSVSTFRVAGSPWTVTSLPDLARMSTRSIA